MFPSSSPSMVAPASSFLPSVMERESRWQCFVQFRLGASSVIRICMLIHFDVVVVGPELRATVHDTNFLVTVWCLFHVTGVEDISEV